MVTDAQFLLLQPRMILVLTSMRICRGWEHPMDTVAGSVGSRRAMGASVQRSSPRAFRMSCGVRALWIVR